MTAKTFSLGGYIASPLVRVRVVEDTTPQVTAAIVAPGFSEDEYYQPAQTIELRSSETFELFRQLKAIYEPEKP